MINIKTCEDTSASSAGKRKEALKANAELKIFIERGQYSSKTPYQNHNY